MSGPHTKPGLPDEMKYRKASDVKAMSNTPRTDAFGKVLVSWCGDEERCLEFARQLETELAEARKQLVERDALVERIRNLVADDSFAMTFQTMGQYRTELLRRMAKGE